MAEKAWICLDCTHECHKLDQRLIEGRYFGRFSECAKSTMSEWRILGVHMEGPGIVFGWCV